MENLKTQTVKRMYLVRTTTAPTSAQFAPTMSLVGIVAESVSAALRGASEYYGDFSSYPAGTFDVSVSLADVPDKELYTNTLFAPGLYVFLRKCAEDAAMIACKVYEGGHDK